MAKMYQTTWFYKFLRVHTNAITTCWGSKIEINNSAVIPRNTSVIFAPNHQNALIDAMTILKASPEPIVFLAKAAIFSNRVFKATLNGLKIMPAYRMRDGYANLKKNEESFEEAVKVLSHNEYFCLMPEGGQDEKRRLRPLVKGMFRIAFAAQKLKPKGESVLIIPVGLDYGHYDHSGGHVVVNFGQPIKVADYFEDYLQNEAVTQNKIRDDLYNRMKPLMLHIASEKYYDTFYAASYVYNAEMLYAKDWQDNETNRLEIRQRIVNELEKAEKAESPLLDELEERVKDWLEGSDHVELLSKANEEGDKFDLGVFVSLIYMIVAFPVFLFAMALSGIQWLSFKGIAYKMAHGTGFEGSFKLGLVYVVLPFLYIFEVLLFALIPNPLKEVPFGWLVFLMSLPLSFKFIQNYSWKFRKVKARLQTIFGKGKKADAISELMRKIVPNIA